MPRPQVLGTFEGVAQTVRQTLVDSLVQILSPKRRIDILRDVMTARQAGRPYVVAFCGVNGVGKSNNLAKVRRAERGLRGGKVGNRVWLACTRFVLNVSWL